MGDVGEAFRDYNAHKKQLRNKYGVECPECKRRRPKANATILMPAQRCKVDKYCDPRPRLTNEEWSNA